MNNHATMASYVTGFALSVALTLVAYFAVEKHALPSQTLVLVIALLGVVQLLVQLALFLHLGKESKPRMHLAAFLFMALIVGIIVVGTLWIMAHLKYDPMPPIDVSTYLINQ